MIWWVLGGIGVVGVLGAVVYFIRRALINAVSVEHLEAANELGVERVESMEDAARVDRVRARKETDAKAAAVRDADDAARMLREAFDDPETLN